MAFSSSTVSIGHNTKKSDYERLLDNTQYNKSQTVSEISRIQSGTVSFEGAKTFNSSTVFNATATFNNPVVHNSGTVSNSTATFNSSIIFPAYGLVGTLVLAGSTAWSVSTEYLPGTTVAGNTLIVSSTGGATYGQPLSGENYIAQTVFSIGGNQSLSLTGTWRLLSRVARGSASGWYPVGLFQRIS